VEKSFRRKTGQRKGSDESAQPLLCNETSSWEEKGKCGEEVREYIHVGNYRECIACADYCGM
jgi:hypothetical protein